MEPRDTETPTHSSKLTLIQLASCVIGSLIVAEVLVRIFISSPSRIVIDEELGWQYQPNSTSLIASNDAGYSRIRTNELGLNDEPLQPKNGRLRVLVIGDSFVEAIQVPRSDNFTSVIGRENPLLEAVNAGRAGLDPIGALTVFERLASKIDADYAVLFVTDNDIKDLENADVTIEYCPDSAAICELAPHFSTKNKLRGLLLPLMTRSALINYLLGRYEELAQAEITRFCSVFDCAAPREEPARASDESDSNAPSTAAIFAYVFAKFMQRQPLLVAYMPSLEFTENRQANIESEEAWVNELEKAAVDAGAGFLNVGPALTMAYQQTGQPPLGFDFGVIGEGHLNSIGHAAIGQAISRRLSADALTSR